MVAPLDRLGRKLAPGVHSVGQRHATLQRRNIAQGRLKGDADCRRRHRHQSIASGAAGACHSNISRGGNLLDDGLQLSQRRGAHGDRAGREAEQRHRKRRGSAGEDEGLDLGLRRSQHARIRVKHAVRRRANAISAGEQVVANDLKPVATTLRQRRQILTLHASLPVLEGDKPRVSLWILTAGQRRRLVLRDRTSSVILAGAKLHLDARFRRRSREHVSGRPRGLGRCCEAERAALLSRPGPHRVHAHDSNEVGHPLRRYRDWLAPEAADDQVRQYSGAGEANVVRAKRENVREVGVCGIALTGEGDEPSKAVSLHLTLNIHFADEAQLLQGAFDVAR
eukprot:scaffold1102_cov256-Pinguiococcus_pyrenoidosus.AAC.20